jgi:hypothetical protein
MMGALRAMDQSHEWLHHDFGPNDANLDAQNNLICGECYVANPPLVDVEIIFTQVIAHMSET